MLHATLWLELDCCSALVCSELPSSPGLASLPDSQLLAHHTHSPDFFSRLLRRSPHHSRELPEQFERSLKSRSYPLISPAHSSLRHNGHHETRDCFWKYCDLCWKVSLKCKTDCKQFSLFIEHEGYTQIQV